MISLASPELIHRAIQAELAYTQSRLGLLARIPGNPIGVEVRIIDNGVAAMMARSIPHPFFNCVMGLRGEHVGEIEALVAWYRDGGVANPHFFMEPGDSDAALGRELARLGYFQSGFHARLAGEPAPAPPPPCGITLETVTDAAAMAAYQDVYAAGWDIPANDIAGFKANTRAWLGLPGWTLFLARIDGRPAGAAMLFVDSGVGYFADAATHPDLRRRGVHGALLRRRTHEAQTLGVDFVFSGAGYLSQSHRDLERIGMRLQSVRAIWSPL
jgi:GNAT superfamily N-acetyltransferase